ncbi:la-related protein 1C-like [Mangifera indica]|uniref:la-related protein 1C-like n=1 Tax=Mangifera indica TaxID=29780 RepID=UPI001CFA6866|nr:la-related protein 1C-like [Mangifera indica]
MSSQGVDSSNNGVTGPNQSRGGAGGGMKAVAVSSPWTQVVQGESGAIASASLSPSVSSTAVAVVEQVGDESADCGTGNAGKKSAWNKLSNGAPDVGTVMGAHAWPALSETTRGSSARSSSESLKGLSDGSSSSSVSQGTGTANSAFQKQGNNNGNPNSTSNYTARTRQRSIKRNGAVSFSNGDLTDQSALQGPAVEGPINNHSPRDLSQQRGSFRNRNGNSHPGRDGSQHPNYGGRRDHDRGNQDWNAHRNFNSRDGHMQHQRVVQRFVRHPPPPPPPPLASSSQYIPPLPVRPFGNHIGFPEFPSPAYYVPAPHSEALRGVPFVAPPPLHALFFPALDPHLHSSIVKQIDYYFSNENLIRDTYLRQNMDDQGWVPITLIAGFRKVSLLTNSIQLILDALRSSTVVEVQGDKIRKRNDWMRWIIPPGQFSGVPSGKSSQDKLAFSFRNLSLEQKNANHNNATSRSSSGDLSVETVQGVTDLSNSGDLSMGTGHGGPDRSISAGNAN